MYLELVNVDTILLKVNSWSCQTYTTKGQLMIFLKKKIIMSKAKSIRLKNKTSLRLCKNKETQEYQVMYSIRRVSVHGSCCSYLGTMEIKEYLN